MQGVSKSVIGGIVVGLVVGFALGTLVGLQSNRAKLDEVKKLFPAVPEFTSISGTVKGTDGEVIVVEAVGLPFSPFEKLPRVRRVKVDAATELVKRVSKDPKKFEKEIAEYRKKVDQLQASATGGAVAVPPPIVPPQPFEEKEITLKDIRTGDFVLVEAGESIKLKESFTAKRIVLQAEMVAPAAAPGPVSAPTPTPPPVLPPPLPAVPPVPPPSP